MSNDRARPSCFEGKRVFITGHTGFKGSWLTTWLRRLGAEITGFSLPTEAVLFDQLKLSSHVQDRRGDIRDLPTLRNAIVTARPDFLFHLAAQPLVRVSYREPLETYSTNVTGTAHVLESCRDLKDPCVVVCVTTDKVYRNREIDYAYRENDPLGGYDPYSASKAAAEIVIASYRDSFFPPGHPVRLASARAGNVIGGGDWAEDRLVPDCIRALQAKESIAIRNPLSTRPWQHVLEPLGGYLTLASALRREPKSVVLASAFNFGPGSASNRPVSEVVGAILRHWPGESHDASEPAAPHEAGKLNLATEKALRLLDWKPVWSFEETVAETVRWYRRHWEGAGASELCSQQIEFYSQVSGRSGKDE